MVLNDVMNAFANNRDEMILLSIIPYAGGFLIWVYFYLLSIKEKKLPIPFWLYTFYFAHDSTGAIRFHQLAETHNGFWFFSSTSMALFAWTLVEIGGMILAIKYARQDIWGKEGAPPVTVNKAVFNTVTEIIMMYAVVNLLHYFMDDEVMFKWFSLTNALLAIGPFYVLRQRIDRVGSSVALLMILVVSVGQTFLPPGLGMFTTASPYFDAPWFYIAGVVFTAMAVWNLITLLRMPPKGLVNGKKAIW
ncbi:MAG: hypothetical protein ABWZ40_07610 [Caulobacterales bacterium]